MRYLSLFSGIEAASVAFAPLGWEPVAFAEVDPFASAVLAHHWPDVPNLGDVTAVDWSVYRDTVDLVIAGPPCQDFSIAGRRQSMDGDRGNLSLAYVRAIRAVDPRWAITENVPGWLNTRDNAFGRALAELVGGGEPLVCPLETGWPDAGMVIGPERTAAWRVLDAQYFGMAQRRRRVFVVSGRTHDGTNPGAVLLEPESGGWHPAPSREAGQSVAGSIGSCTAGRGWNNDLDRAGAFIPTLARAVTTGEGGRLDGESCTFVAYQCHGTNVGEMGTLRRGNGNTGGGVPFVTHTLRADGFDAGEDGTGRGTPLVAVPAIGETNRGYESGEVAETVRAGSHGALPMAAVSVALRGREGGATAELGGEVATALRASQGGGDKPHVLTPMAVRRLMPVETERLQGFADDWTLVPYRGKLAADGNRYKAVGNAMAVPVVRWIGERIALVERLREEEA